MLRMLSTKENKTFETNSLIVEILVPNHSKITKVADWIALAVEISPVFIPLKVEETP